MKRVMLDLETLDTGNNALILSIGAKEFDPELAPVGFEGREFYTVVNQRQQVPKWGRTISPSTQKWWDGQTPEAKAVLVESQLETAPYLDTALHKFAEWIGGQDIEIWAHGADFDNIILGNAYAAVGAPRPWSYSKNRCFRTLMNIGKGLVEVPPRAGTHHNALDDAKYQAACATIYLARIGVR